MKHTFLPGLACAAFLVLSPSLARAQEAPTYMIDSAHTRIVFGIDHLGFTQMPGVFNAITGKIRFDPKDILQAHVDATIDVKGLTMGNAALDKILQGPDYFNTKKYPTIRFRSTKFTQNTYEDGEIMGLVTMLGVTKPMILRVHFNKKAHNPFIGAEAIGFSAQGLISRSQFGMTKMLPNVGDDVFFTIALEAHIPTLNDKVKGNVKPVPPVATGGGIDVNGGRKGITAEPPSLTPSLTTAQ